MSTPTKPTPEEFAALLKTLDTSILKGPLKAVEYGDGTVALFANDGVPQVVMPKEVYEDILAYKEATKEET